VAGAQANSLQHGPLVGIFISQRIDLLIADLTVATYGIALDSTITCIPTPLTIGCSNGPSVRKADGRGVSVVQAYNFDKTSYDILGIGPHYNCLYFTLGIRDVYEGWMLQTGERKDCPDVTRSQLQAAVTQNRAKFLFVRADPSGGSNPDDYPPVARWDWDDGHKHQYIGIKCGAAWCEVGQPGFGPSAHYGSGVTGRERRLFVIKGWYDEQQLAVVEKDGIHMHLSPAKGVVVPFPELDGYTHEQLSAAGASGTYLRGWRVYLSANERAYQKYGFKAAWPPIPDGPANIVSIAQTPDGKWKARIEAPDGSVKEMSIANHDHTPLLASGQTFLIPGTARWRWIAKDETTWGKCAYGCCSLDP
jgi:hypothetical protein